MKNVTESQSLDDIKLTGKTVEEIVRAIALHHKKEADLRAQLTALESDAARVDLDGTEDEIVSAALNLNKIRALIRAIETRVRQYSGLLKTAQTARSLEVLHKKCEKLVAGQRRFLEERWPEFVASAEKMAAFCAEEAALANEFLAYRDEYSGLAYEIGNNANFPPMPASLVDQIVGYPISGGTDFRIGDCVRLPSRNGLPVVFEGNLIAGSSLDAAWWSHRRSQPQDTRHASFIHHHAGQPPRDPKPAVREVKAGTHDSGKLANSKGEAG